MTESSDLRDLFIRRKIEDKLSRENVTLGMIFQSSSSSSSSTSRTLVETFRDDEVVYPRTLAVGKRDTYNHRIISWKRIKDRLLPRGNSPPVSPYMQPTTEEEEEGPPARISLMALLDRTANSSELNAMTSNVNAESEREREMEMYVCCVCMVRRKDAAFIPCGHTFCRLCSRELWISSGTCPLCNVYVLQVLDIF